jgi:hypothetical protein
MGLLFLITSDWRACSLCTLKLIISLIKLPYNGRSSGADLLPRVIITNKNLQDGAGDGTNELLGYIKRPATKGIKMGVAPVNDGTTDARERQGLLKETKLQARKRKKGPHLTSGHPPLQTFCYFKVYGACSYVKSKHQHKSCAAPPN